MLDDHDYDGLWVPCLGLPVAQCPPSAKAGAPAWDFRNETARGIFAEEWGSYIATIDFLDGVYADSGDSMGCSPFSRAHNFTAREREELFNGTVVAWRQAALALNRAGKLFTVSLKQSFDALGPPSVLFPSDGAKCVGSNQGTRRNGGEDIIFELMQPAQWVPFRQYNIPSKDFGKGSAGCVNAVENVRMEAERGPTFVCCNDANKTMDGGAGLNVSLAAYLMNANERSYFGPGLHWANGGWEHVFDDFPQLQLPLGAPRTPSFQRSASGFQFSRSFEHLDVSLDCRPSGGECGTHTTSGTCQADTRCGWTTATTRIGGACIDWPTANFKWRTR